MSCASVNTVILSLLYQPTFTHLVFLSGIQTALYSLQVSLIPLPLTSTRRITTIGPPTSTTSTNTNHVTVDVSPDLRALATSLCHPGHQYWHNQRAAECWHHTAFRLLPVVVYRDLWDELEKSWKIREDMSTAKW
jgi:hypothetical protein